MKVNLEVIKAELESSRRGFVEIDPMCDAWATEARNRRYNEALKQKITALEIIIANYDKVTEAEWDEVNCCFYYGYKVLNKLQLETNFVWKKVEDKVYLYKGRRINGYYNHEYTVEECRETFEYVRNAEGKIETELVIAEHLINFTATASRMQEIINKKEDEATLLEAIKEAAAESKFNSATYFDLIDVRLHGITITETLERLIAKNLIVEKVVTYTKNGKEGSFSTYKVA